MLEMGLTNPQNEKVAKLLSSISQQKALSEPVKMTYHKPDLAEKSSKNCPKTVAQHYSACLGGNLNFLKPVKAMDAIF